LLHYLLNSTTKPAVVCYNVSGGCSESLGPLVQLQGQGGAAPAQQQAEPLQGWLASDLPLTPSTPEGTGGAPTSDCARALGSSPASGSVTRPINRLAGA
jgi:hypothetical protein